MRWNEHTEYTYNKTKYLIFMFYKLAKLITTGTLMMIYYALFHSIISYGIIAWGLGEARILTVKACSIDYR